MTVKPYALTTHDGKRVDQITHYALLAVEKKLGYPLTITQGSYNAGGVSASAGTHDGGGVVDLKAWDWERKVHALRSVGFAAWHRPAIKGLWPEHIHAVLIGNAKLSPAAARQVQAYFAGRDGLASNRIDPDTFHPRVVFQMPVSVVTRVATFNILGSHHTDPGGKNEAMPAGPDRMRAAIRLLNEAGITVAGLQELETPQAAVIEARKRWTLVRGRPNQILRGGNAIGNGLMFRRDHWTCLNANSIAVEFSRGRTLYLPRVRLQHIKTGAVIRFIVVHAPSTGPFGGTDADRLKVQAAAVAGSRSGPCMILGDFNEHAVTLPGFTVAAHSGLDWVFERAVSASDPAVDRTVLGTVSDHPIVSTAVTVTKGA